MSTARDFHIGDILSVTTGKLVSPRLIAGVYDILNHMTGQSLFTHQLPRAMDACAPVLLKRHPQLATEGLEDVTAENWHECLAAAVARLGETLPVEILAPGIYAPANPLTELLSIMGSERVTVVVTDDTIQ